MHKRMYMYVCMYVCVNMCIVKFGLVVIVGADVIVVIRVATLFRQKAIRIFFLLLSFVCHQKTLSSMPLSVSLLPFVFSSLLLLSVSFSRYTIQKGHMMNKVSYIHLIYIIYIITYTYVYGSMYIYTCVFVAGWVGVCVGGCGVAWARITTAPVV